MSSEFLILAEGVNVSKSLVVKGLRNHSLYGFAESLLSLSEFRPGIKNVPQTGHIVTLIALFNYLLNGTVHFQSFLLALFYSLAGLYGKTLKLCLMSFPIICGLLYSVSDFELGVYDLFFRFLDLCLSYPVLECSLDLIEH